MTATQFLIWGMVIHLFADWVLQSDWQAKNKTGLLHPAAYIHSGIQFVCMLLIFPWHAALIIAITHMIIDTRKPLIWWRSVFRQTTEGPSAIHVAMWGDQVVHIAIIAVTSLFIANGRL